MLTAEEQAEFFAAIDAVKITAQRQLAQRVFPTNVIHLFPQLYRHVDDLFVKMQARGKTIACRAGCSYCCHVKLEAKQAEVDYIARQLKQLPADEFAHIVAHMRQGFVEKQALAQSNLGQRGPCVLLENQQCMIYANRPGVCRKAHSIDAQRCADGDETIPQHLDLILKAEALIQGVGAAVEEVMPEGTAPESKEFTDALWVALAVENEDA
ncbi:YkgJ family cysteine cluster protein [Undibacterium sp. RuRC25W]|uniref:YkgJ family cysteine cluster protein n=1 Tax=Undibacterium sp. RuRC25W TaxID=3413047 RepID=UPI003BF046B1